MSIMEMLAKQLEGGALKQISQQIGADEATTQTAAKNTLSTLVGALSRNAGKSGGAEALNAALEKDHDGSILDNLSAHLQTGNTAAGEGILKHVLGSRRPQVEAGLGKTSGLDADSMGKLMTMLAPVVLGAVGKARRENSMDAAGLKGLLGTEREAIEQREPSSKGLLAGLLDADGDGDVDLGDLGNLGKGLLSKFMK